VRNALDPRGGVAHVLHRDRRGRRHVSSCTSTLSPRDWHDRRPRDCHPTHLQPRTAAELGGLSSIPSWF
jgi:hypothetical protein